jgi:hypothetical protein
MMMSESMLVKYLVNRAQIDAGTNAFISATCRLAHVLGTDNLKQKRLEYIEALFVSMIAYSGFKRMLSRLKEEQETAWSSLFKHPHVNHDESLCGSHWEIW